MKILELPWIWDWCREHGAPLDGDGADLPVPISLGDDPAQRHAVRATLDANTAVAVRQTIDPLGDWDECLVWMTDWGVWPSNEDWPRFYAWRGSHGVRLSLEVAPGHLFTPDDVAGLREMVEQIIEFGWDATLLLAKNGRVTDRRLLISHDEWIEVRSTEPVDLPTPG